MPMVNGTAASPFTVLSKSAYWQRCIEVLEQLLKTSPVLEARRVAVSTTVPAEVHPERRTTFDFAIGKYRTQCKTVLQKRNLGC